MIRFNSTLAASAFSLLIFTACTSNPQQPAADNSTPAATNAPTTSSEAPAKTAPGSSATDNPKAGFVGMKDVVSKTTVAVNAGNFDKAKEEFEKFEGYWSKVEDGVKAKSADSYKKIEDEMDKVENSLKAAKPDKGKATAALQALSKTLDTYASSL